MTKNQHLVIIVAIVAVILGGSVYYFYLQPVRFDFQKNLADAQNLHDQGKDREAVKMLEEKIIPNAADEKSEAIAKITLAASYFNIDFQKGISLFKEIAADESYPGFQRAFAVSYMANILMLGSRGPSLWADAIFSGEPYVSFPEIPVPGQQASQVFQVFVGGRRLYQYASSFYPLPANEYRIAEWYAKTALAAVINPKYKPARSVSEKIANAKTHLQNGDDAFVANLGILNDTDKGYAKWVKGETLALLAEVEKDQSYNQAAETAFKDSLDFLKSNAGSSSARSRNSLLLWANFYYATFLERAYGDSRTSDIKALTANINETVSEQKNGKFGSNPLGFIRYLTRVGGTDTDIADTYERQSALALAKRDANFASVLKEFGWKF
ncbi:MAG: hypothetical protein Q8Q17_02490 [bacterium]|nr:hypothetical protein [bacterium]